METEPLVFGDNGTEVAPKLERHPELHAVARKVIATLEPLDPSARLRVIRAAAILLELDDAFAPWIR